MRAPLLLLHGFTDTARTWELVRPALERRHDVLAPTLPGHWGGPPLPEPATEEAIVDVLERVLDEAGWETAHVAGNSLGGYLALKLAERGRARSVVALAPAGGWADGDDSYRETLQYFVTMHELVLRAAPRADGIARSSAGRRSVMKDVVVRWEHLSPDFVAHVLVGSARCEAVQPLVDRALARGWPLDPARVDCPLRIVWGTDDRLLPWPSTAARYHAWFPHAEWVELPGVGHCPQLDVPIEAAQMISAA